MKSLPSARACLPYLPSARTCRLRPLQHLTPSLLLGEPGSGCISRRAQPGSAPRRRARGWPRDPSPRLPSPARCLPRVAAPRPRAPRHPRRLPRSLLQPRRTPHLAHFPAGAEWGGTGASRVRLSGGPQPPPARPPRLGRPKQRQRRRRRRPLRPRSRPRGERSRRRRLAPLPRPARAASPPPAARARGREGEGGRASARGGRAGGRASGRVGGAEGRGFRRERGRGGGPVPSRGFARPLRASAGRRARRRRRACTPQVAALPRGWMPRRRDCTVRNAKGTPGE